MDCLKYLSDDLFSELEETMIGVSEASEGLLHHGARSNTGSVVGELRTFGKECK